MKKTSQAIDSNKVITKSHSKDMIKAPHHTKALMTAHHPSKELATIRHTSKELVTKSNADKLTHDAAKVHASFYHQKNKKNSSLHTAHDKIKPGRK